MNYPSDNRVHDCMITNSGTVTYKECAEKQNILICSSLCPFYKQEIFSDVDYGGIELTEVGRGKVSRFAKDFFIPNLYECLYCEVCDIEFSIVNSNKITVDLSFQIKSRVKRNVDKREVYFCDKWKKDKIQIDDNIFPLVGIYTLNDAPVNVVGRKYKIDDRKEKVGRLNDVLFTWLPGSICVDEQIDVSNMPEFANQKYVIAGVNKGKVIEGKNNIILGDLYLNKTYDMSIDCYFERATPKAQQIIMNIGVFFPFPLVNYKKYTNSISEDLKMNEESEYRLVAAKKERIEKYLQHR